MTPRCIAISLALAAFVLWSPNPAVAQTDVPRTVWGQPDLQGVWDFRTITPMERPDDLSGQEFLTSEEASELEQTRAAQNAARDGEVPADIVGNYNTFWFDRGESVIGTMRTALVTDPPDGRIPPLTTAAEQKRAVGAEAREHTGPHEPTPGGWVDDLGPNGLQVRCITGFNSGPPMTPGGYNNNVQLFQTSDTVVLFNEMNHNVRVVPLDGRPHTELRQWTGDSRGHWEGDTLVVETTNFMRETSFMRGGASADLRLTERFTRVSRDVLLYRVTVDDPTTWIQPWTYEVPMKSNPDPVYEYACHEGNYAMEVILAGARAKEAEVGEQ